MPFAIQEAKIEKTMWPKPGPLALEFLVKLQELLQKKQYDKINVFLYIETGRCALSYDGFAYDDIAIETLVFWYFGYWAIRYKYFVSFLTIRYAGKVNEEIIPYLQQPAEYLIMKSQECFGKEFAERLAQQHKLSLKWQESRRGDAIFYEDLNGWQYKTIYYREEN